MCLGKIFQRSLPAQHRPIAAELVRSYVCVTIGYGVMKQRDTVAPFHILVQLFNLICE